MKKTFSIFILLLIHASVNAQLTIGIMVPEKYNSDSCVQLTLKDVIHLFNSAKGGSAKLNDHSADMLIQIPLELDSVTLKKDAFKWKRKGKTWTLNSSTPKGISNGLYAWMQEIMNFQFYHAREINLPDLSFYKPDYLESFEGEPVFKDMGFHLHTMHPIELTEDLLDHTRPGALDRIYEYINWLARNGQNYFEFNVLESIQLEAWIPHARKISDYAHKRGIRCGLDLSLHMLQQKAFQLYEAPPFKFAAVKKQIDYNVRELAKTNFDIWNVELSATEFTTGNQDKKKEVLIYLTNLLTQNNIELMSRNHVVKPDQMVNGGNGDQAGEILADGQGLMVHTVMFYTLTDEKAPVYRNKNLRHMYDIMKAEKKKRKTWYFPESAYWVTFDSSVPMFLLPYFSARLSDINVCEQEEIEGHLTFTSGWEWGYCYIDWSIARWCWNYKKDGAEIKKTSLQYLTQLCNNEIFMRFLQEEEKLQQEYIKDMELIRVMVAQTVTDELPGSLNLEFHPRPVFSYPYIRNNAGITQLDSVLTLYLEPLYTYSSIGLGIESRADTTKLNRCEREMYDGIRITHLRAWHRWVTLSYLHNYRMSKIKKEDFIKSYLLQDAETIRYKALQVVNNREKNYRYDLNLLTTKHKDHTCYHFGYLYTVHNLHFWEREELQAKTGKYNFLYKNIWNVGRTVGLID